MESQRSNFKILLFPWLAHGHIFPYLELAKRILNNLNFHIFFCTTSINFTSITTFIQTNRLQESIELLELNLEPHPQLPPHYHTTKNLPSHLNLTLLKAFQTAKSSFSNIINDVKPHLVIYDAFQPWAATLASSLAVPAVHFSPFGAASVSFNHHYYTCFLNDDQFPFPEICLKGHERKSSDALFEFLYSDVFDQDKDIYFVNLKLSSEVVLLKANRGLEEKYIDYVSSASHKRILPVGPLVSDIANNEDDSDMILQWLSKKEQHSTVYISFGSEYFLSKQEIEEIAKGIELSGSNFIWIIRFPTMENTVVTINELLPEGFLERVKDRGMVLSGWAPQGSILRHPSTGAFLSHCGWSSLNESIYYGVPVISMPMKLNMFIDAKMLVDAGGCVEVVRDAGRVYYNGEEIGKAIKEVMSGKRMRERAQHLSEKMRQEEKQAMEETAQHLLHLCCKNKAN